MGCKEFTISMPREMLAQIDYLRGNDITRSRMIQKIFQEYIKITGMEMDKSL